MPQLDKFIFFNQFFWFSVFFFFLYFFTLYVILPLIFKILKFRLKKINFLVNFFESLNLQKDNSIFNLNLFLIHKVNFWKFTLSFLNNLKFVLFFSFK